MGERTAALSVAGNARIKSALVRIDSQTQYTILADVDTLSNGNEIVVKVVDFTQRDRATPLRITAPGVGQVFRFVSNGARTNTSAAYLEITDTTTGLHGRVDVGSGGVPRLRF